MLDDLRYALRVLFKTPAFSAIAVLTLALGIGANSAIFSVVNAALLRPLPFPKADRLVRVYEAADDNGARGTTLNLSEQTVRQWREFGHDIFEGIGAATGSNVTVGALGNEPARNTAAARIDAQFLHVLGLAPELGRGFTVAEDQPGGPAVALISNDLWREQLGARPDIVGTTLLIDSVPHTIVGVMPKMFRHPYRANVWLPLAMAPALPAQANHYLYGVGRLRAGITPTQAEAAVRRMCAAIKQQSPDPNNAHAAYLPPLAESFVTDLRPKLLVIEAAAFCALLIAAANFAGLLLTRVVEREGEFALRAALGASRGRLVRQHLAQAVLLALAGTVLGLMIAWWATPALVAMSPEGADATGSAMREFDYVVRLDWPVFAFAAGVMLAVGLGFGLLPALRAARTDLRGAISSISRGATLDKNTRRLLGSFVVVELAVAAILLVASLTAAQYFRTLLDEPWGFSTEGRVAFSANYSERLFSGVAEQQTIDATLSRLREIPGVGSVTVTCPSPMNAPRDLITCNPEGSQAPEPTGFYLSYLRVAPPGYFKSMGQQLLRGREFLESDGPNTSPVCAVTASFARRFWPGQDPIGKRVKWGRLDGARPWLTVVGLVGDTKVNADSRDGEVIGTLTRPLAQMLAIVPNPLDDVTFIVEMKSGHLALDSAIRAAVMRADSRVAVYHLTSLEQAAAESRVTERFIFVLVSLFGALGLVLAAVGLYGLLSLNVARRQREFGIRSALGATAAQLIRMVTRQGATLLAIGFVVGGLAIVLLVRLVHSQWVGMPGPDTLSWIIAGGVLCFVVGLACWVPARRASRIDPVIALRAE